MPRILKALELPSPNSAVKKSEVDAPSRFCAIANLPATSCVVRASDQRLLSTFTSVALHQPKPAIKAAITTSAAIDLTLLIRNAIGSETNSATPLAMSWPREPLFKITARAKGIDIVANKRIAIRLGRPRERAHIKHTV